MLNGYSRSSAAAQDVLFDIGIEKQPGYLTSAQLAEALSVSVHTVRKWRKLRIITPEKFRGSVRWLLEDVLQELRTGDRNAKS